MTVLDETTNNPTACATETKNNQPMTLSKVVELKLNDYFANLDVQSAKNVYDMVIKEVEKGILSVVLKQVNGNQSKAAVILGLSRGTLRKKLKENNMEAWSE